MKPIRCADIANAIFTTAPAVSLIITLVLDNTIPGTIRERGLHVWLKVKGAAENWWDDDNLHDVSFQLYPTPRAALGLLHLPHRRSVYDKSRATLALASHRR